MTALPGPKFLWSAGLVLAATILLLTALWFSGLREAFSLPALQIYGDQLREQAKIHFIPAALLMIFIEILIVVFCLPAVALMMFFAGFVFGALWGGIIALTGSVTGAAILFLLTRSVFGRFLRDRAKGLYAKIAGPMEEDAFFYLLFMRLVPIFPFFLVNIVPALFNIPLRLFILSTAIGIMPVTFIYAWLGQALGRVDKVTDLFSPQIALALTLLGLLALLPILIKAIKKRRNAGVLSDMDNGS
jgi:uncharacterized membrane protein YdjX (TVP38/TMEM64 family)